SCRPAARRPAACRLPASCPIEKRGCRRRRRRKTRRARPRAPARTSGKLHVSFRRAVTSRPCTFDRWLKLSRFWRALELNRKLLAIGDTTPCDPGHGLPCFTARHSHNILVLLRALHVRRPPHPLRPLTH